MRYLIKYIFLIFTITLVSSCESQYDIGDDSDGKLVVNCVFVPGEQLKLDVLETYNIDGVDKGPIVDAEVSIEEEIKSDSGTESTFNTYKLEFVYESGLDKNGNIKGYYTNENLIPKSGAYYKLIAAKNGYRTATASSQCPFPIIIKNKSIEDEFINDEFKFKSVVEVELREGASKLYSITVNVDTIKSSTSSSTNGLFLNDSKYSFQSFIDDIGSSATLTWSENISLPDDINEKVKKYYEPSGISLEDENTDQPSRGDINNNPKNNKAFEVSVLVYNLSSQVYNYGYSITLFNETKGLPISEDDRPLLYSNIENGQGIFGGISYLQLLY